MDMDLAGLCKGVGDMNTLGGCWSHQHFGDSCDDIVHMGATTVRATTLWRSCDDISHMEL